MEFFIKQNATLPVLKMQIVKDGRSDYVVFMDQLEVSTIYFSMINTANGIPKVVSAPANIVEKTFAEPGTPVEYYVYFQFTSTMTNTPGRYVGQFEIEFLDGTGTLIAPIREELFLNVLEGSIKKSTDKKESLIAKKVDIDGEVINLRPEDIDREVESIIEKGKKKKDDYENAKESFEKMVEPNYDEDLHKDYVKIERELNLEVDRTKSKIKETQGRIKNLEEGEFCSLCKQPLADVDHSEEIEENKKLLQNLGSDLLSLTEKLLKANKLVEEQDKIKSSVSESRQFAEWKLSSCERAKSLAQLKRSPSARLAADFDQ
jgi:hypothetical protein